MKDHFLASFGIKDTWFENITDLNPLLPEEVDGLLIFPDEEDDITLPMEAADEHGSS